MAKNSITHEWEANQAGVIPHDIMSFLRDALAPMQGRRVRLTLEEVKRAASSPQKRYYWGVVVPMVHRMFHDSGTHVIIEEVHEYLKKHVGGIERTIVDPGSGEHTSVTRSINELDKRSSRTSLRRCACGRRSSAWTSRPLPWTWSLWATHCAIDVMLVW